MTKVQHPIIRIDQYSPQLKRKSTQGSVLTSSDDSLLTSPGPHSLESDGYSSDDSTLFLAVQIDDAWLISDPLDGLPTHDPWWSLPGGSRPRLSEAGLTYDEMLVQPQTSMGTSTSARMAENIPDWITDVTASDGRNHSIQAEEQYVPMDMNCDAPG